MHLCQLSTLMLTGGLLRSRTKRTEMLRYRHWHCPHLVRICPRSATDLFFLGIMPIGLLWMSRGKVYGGSFVIHPRGSSLCRCSEIILGTDDGLLSGESPYWCWCCLLKLMRKPLRMPSRMYSTKERSGWSARRFVHSDWLSSEYDSQSSTNS